MIPTKTGAAAAVGLVLPHLNGSFDGFSMRVPTINVSIVDLTFLAKKATTVDEVNKAVKIACHGDPARSRASWNTTPSQLVSSDFNHNPASSVFDSTLTKVVGRHAGEGLRVVRQRVGLLQPHVEDVAAVFAEVGAVAAK